MRGTGDGGWRTGDGEQGTSTSRLPSPASRLPLPVILLSDCILRGEAVALRVQHGRGLQFTWTNGLLVTSEQFLVADGEGTRGWGLGARDEGPGVGQWRDSSSPAPSPQPLVPSLKIDLQHLTAVVRGGLCRFVETESAPRQVPAQWDVSSCILIGSSAAPLVEQTGVAAETARQRIVWNGDRNFYEAFSIFWNVQFASPDPGTMRSMAADGARPPETMTFEAWQTHWGPEQEICPVANQVQWRHLPAADRPLHTDGPADYALAPASPSGPNPAVGAANDGRDAGAQMDRLPEVPPLSPDPSPGLTSPPAGANR